MNKTIKTILAGFLMLTAGVASAVDTTFGGPINHTAQVSNVTGSTLAVNVVNFPSAQPVTLSSGGAVAISTGSISAWVQNFPAVQEVSVVVDSTTASNPTHVVVQSSTVAVTGLNGGPVPVTGAFYQSVQQVALTSTTISTGSVSAWVQNFPTSYPGPVSLSSTTISTGSISAWVQNFPAIQAVGVTVDSTTVSNPTHVVLQASTAAVTGLNGGPVAVSGSFFQAVQPDSVLGTTFTAVNPGYVIWLSSPPVTVANSTVAVTNVNGQNLNVAVPGGVVVSLSSVTVSTGSITSYQGGSWTAGVNNFPAVQAVSVLGTTFTAVNPGYVVWAGTNPVALANSTVAVTNVSGQNLNVSVSNFPASSGIVSLSSTSISTGSISAWVQNFLSSAAAYNFPGSALAAVSSQTISVSLSSGSYASPFYMISTVTASGTYNSPRLSLANGTSSNLQLDSAGSQYTNESRITALKLAGADEDVFGTGVVGYRVPMISACFFNLFSLINVTTTSAGGATVLQTPSSGILTSGTGVTASASIITNSKVNYVPGSEEYVIFTASFSPTTNANEIERVGLYDGQNGFWFGYSGTSFGLAVRNSGVDTFISTSSWNGDTLSGASSSAFTSGGVPQIFNPANINLFRIRFGWLGAAPIAFEMAIPDGGWDVVHTVRQPNFSNTPSIATPILPITMEVVKTGADATNLSMGLNCVSAGSVHGVTYDSFISTEISSVGQSIQLPTGNSVAANFDFQGIFSGAFQVQGHNSDGNWIPISVQQSSTGYVMSSVTSTGEFIADIAAFQAVRAIATSWSSGVSSVTLNLSDRAPFLNTNYLRDAQGNGLTSTGGALNVQIATQSVVTSTNGVIGSVSLGNVSFKTNVFVSSNAAEAINAAVVILSSYTVPAGKTFYLQHFDMGSALVAPSVTAGVLGAVTFYIQNGSLISSRTFTNNSGDIGQYQLDFVEPVGFPAFTTILSTAQSQSATATRFFSQIMGYTK